MGHSCIETTMIYLHLRKLDILKVVSPLDTLMPGNKDNSDDRNTEDI